MEMKMVKIQVDGNTFEVEPGKNLLHTCLALGFDIPYFCFHPALGSVGACRQCAVKKFANADDKKGRIVMSCMEPVVDGLIVSIDDPDAKAFRAAIIESLMTNHPHDCPVCDEGGECHLQDMTVMTGHDYRRFRFKKRTYLNQYLGPYVYHEMNRCIQCYRCVRFYRDYAGGRDLHVMGSANRVYFGRHEEGKLESEFSGNLVEVCPTGVFTDNTLRQHYTRKWDLTNSPSICTHCSLGCNTIVSQRYGEVRRMLSRYNKAVNGYFLCDRGRFGYRFINSPGRIKKTSLKDPVHAQPENLADNALISALVTALKGKKIAGVGSPEASLESNFALETLVGRENFFHGIPDDEYDFVKEAVDILRNSGFHSPSLNDIEKSDAVLILGDDPSENAPVMALSIRQASRNRSFDLAVKSKIPTWNDAAVRDLAQDVKSPIFLIVTNVTKIDDLAEIRHIASSDDIAMIGSAIASFVAKKQVPEGFDGSAKEMAQKIATALMNAASPVIITGTGTKNRNVLRSAADIVSALSNAGKKPSLSLIFPKCNSLGLGLMEGRPLRDLSAATEKRDIETMIVLENDIYELMSQEKADELFDNCKNIIVLHHSMNDTARKADIILPSATYAESTGTIVNNEGRAQRYFRVLPGNPVIREAWEHISMMIGLAETGSNRWQHFDEVVSSIVEAYPFFSGIKDIIPDSKFRYYNEKIARQTARFSGRTAMNADVNVSEPRPPDDDDSALNFSMEGFKGVPTSYLIPYYWSPGWNSPQAMNKYMDEPGGFPPDGNPGVLLFDGLMSSEKKDKA